MPASAATQRFIARKLLGLPAAILRLMSGGGVVYQGGRTLDPRIQFLAARAKAAAPLQMLSPPEARTASDAGLALVAGEPEPGVRVEALTVEGPAGPIPARAYRPDNQSPDAPLMIYAHMGGGVIGGLDTCHTFCTILAACARAPVLSIDYRLAPEHRFPAGLEDTMAALRWGRANAERFGAPAGAVAIGGDSMGGGFAAAICQMLRQAGEPQPALQLLIYPWVDVACESASMTIYGESYPLNRALLDWFAAHYLGPADHPSDPRLSPLAAPDLTGLAPAIVVTAGFDPLVDQGEAYARRLKAAGVPVAYRCYDSLSHGFTAFTGAVPCADVACREIAGLVREGLEGRIA
jgi:acetyl esterase/lipase